jgi:hypothetical protein
MLQHLQQPVPAGLCEIICCRAQGVDEGSQRSHRSNQHVLRWLRSFFERLWVIFQDVVDERFRSTGLACFAQDLVSYDILQDDVHDTTRY